MAVTLEWSECCPSCGDAMEEIDEGITYCSECRIGYNEWTTEYTRDCDKEDLL